MIFQGIKSKLSSRLSTIGYNLYTKHHHLFIQSQLRKVSLENAKNIHTHMTQAELNTLYDLARGLNKSVKALEIGSYLGASTCYIAAAISCNHGHLFCVDTWENQTMPEGERDTFAEFKQNTAGAKAYITTVRKNSNDLTVSDFVDSLDFVFIDGDHSYRGVKNDYQKVNSWISEGGIIAFHDCTYFESVSRLLGEIIATGQWQIGGKTDSLVWLRKVGKQTYTFPNPMQTNELVEIN